MYIIGYKCKSSMKWLSNIPEIEKSVPKVNGIFTKNQFTRMER